ncbi:hypothetical protein N3K66_008359 [Trichothecium roseum]|uniref:Uncharacterized protein n=1 Tax=Trichothecium roseum TaxID=47278 RepID=A0ACC0URP2_9HYPO|nr:hypothetical protein N3K66_008359 [Trichothecium roseum]
MPLGWIGRTTTGAKMETRSPAIANYYLEGPMDSTAVPIALDGDQPIYRFQVAPGELTTIQTKALLDSKTLPKSGQSFDRPRAMAMTPSQRANLGIQNNHHHHHHHHHGPPAQIYQGGAPERLKPIMNLRKLI